MSLEEKIRAYAAKGELVHLSLAYSATERMFVAAYTAASTLAGRSIGKDADPVEAIEKAFKASPAKPAKVKKPRHEEVVAQLSGGEEGARLEKEGGLRSDWTTP